MMCGQTTRVKYSGRAEKSTLLPSRPPSKWDHMHSDRQSTQHGKHAAAG
jgi:hypothetical protein